MKAWLLMVTTPALEPPRDRLLRFRTFFVQTLAVRPKREALARAMASSGPLDDHDGEHGAEGLVAHERDVVLLHA